MVSKTNPTGVKMQQKIEECLLRFATAAVGLPPIFRRSDQVR
jgi:hypothetical protein